MSLQRWSSDDDNIIISGSWKSYCIFTSVLQSRPESLTEAREVRVGGQTCTSQLKAALDNACLVFAPEKRPAVWGSSQDPQISDMGTVWCSAAVLDCTLEAWLHICLENKTSEMTLCWVFRVSQMCDPANLLFPRAQEIFVWLMSRLKRSWISSSLNPFSAFIKKVQN